MIQSDALQVSVNQFMEVIFCKKKKTLEKPIHHYTTAR